ncbi:MAG: 3-keto-disaccharide hydrolase [Planctomycetota bacterium]
MKNGRYGFLTNGGKTVALISLLFLSLFLSSCADHLVSGPALEARRAIEAADPAMGDWQGSWILDDESDSGPLVAQVIALGKGTYRTNFYGQFDIREEPVAVLQGRREGQSVRFAGPARYEDDEIKVQGAIEGRKFTGTFKGQDESGSFAMEREIRLSPTLGAKPPAGAVLFDGKNFDKWKHTKKEPGPVQWKLVDGAMEVKPRTGSIITIKEFADVKLHLEFRTPFMPDARGQGRGNSGVYLQGRYEVQVLDSYGLEGKDNECGGIYQVAPPLVNMCAPPMQWQTYDIMFQAPRFDSAGKPIRDARMTVIHNGVKIHDNVEISKATKAAPGGDVSQRGGIYLQDHSNPVQYRNIWLVEL